MAVVIITIEKADVSKRRERSGWKDGSTKGQA